MKRIFKLFAIFTLSISGCIKGTQENVPVKENPIAEVILFKENAGRPNVSPDGKYLAYHAKDKEGIYNIYIMDLTNGDITCITDDPSLPKGHKGQPWWHPSGKWIIYQAEMDEHIKPHPHPLAVPGIGYHNNIWIAKIEGTKAIKHFQLTDLKTKKSIFDKTPASAVLQPNFSPDGKKVAWSQRIGEGPEWGKWAIKIADFVIRNDTPYFENIKTYTPGENKNYYEANEFGNDGKRLLITGNLEKGQSVYGCDIYWFDPEKGELQKLTFSLDYFDECPHLSPDGKKIVFLSTRGFKKGKSRAWWRWAKGEFWIMDADGRNQKRLTYFNEPGYPEYTGKRVIPAYIDFMPDGKTLFLGVVIEKRRGKLVDMIYKAILKQ